MAGEDKLIQDHRDIDTSLDDSVHDLAITIGLMACELGLADDASRSREVLKELSAAESEFSRVIAPTKQDDLLREIANELHQYLQNATKFVNDGDLPQAKTIAKNQLRNIALAMRDYRMA
jgi:hypothetical protein